MAPYHQQQQLLRTVIQRMRRLTNIYNNSFSIDSNNSNMTTTTTTATTTGGGAKLVVRKLPEEKDMALSFNYSSKYVNERWFHLQRSQNEQLKKVLARIAQNVYKEAVRASLKAAGAGAGQAGAGAALEAVGDIAKDEVKLFFEGKEVNGETVNAEAFKEGAVLKVGESEFQIELNPPRITKLKLPKSIMAGYRVFPSVGVEFTDVKDCGFEWYRSRSGETSTSPPQVDGEHWEKVGDGYTYRTAGGDVGRYLMVQCTPLSGEKRGLTNKTVATVPVSEGPGECPFHRRHAFTPNATAPGRFRVMTYNILANLYADSDTARNDLFPTCPAYALDIEYRRQLLLNEIEGYNCDVFCLQEVDQKMFERALRPVLSESNYDGVYTSKGGKVSEGLSCFYNKNKFSLVSQHDLVLNEALTSEPGFADYFEAIKKNEKLLDKFLKRTTALQVVVLQARDVPDRKLCIANTHLYFRPTADNVRLLQSGMCLRHIEQIVAYESAKDPACKVAVVFCGDFNSTPPFGVYQLMTTQLIPEDHADWRSEEDEAISFSINQPFALVSSCNMPDYTNYTVGFNGCLDYIFSESTFLRVEEIVPMHTHEEVTEFVAIPSIKVPSDHLALICTLKWKEA